MAVTSVSNWLKSRSRPPIGYAPNAPSDSSQPSSSLNPRYNAPFLSFPHRIPLRAPLQNSYLLHLFFLFAAFLHSQRL
ncbi:hypothetical protein, partial [Mycobacterium avium]|uniref:hypothetical protein n=1 Tax=Mycobacterium avium TaxID=1764 RepID=UPI001CA49B84